MKSKSEKKGTGSSLAVRRVITVLLCFFGGMFLLAETYALLTVVIPYVAIAMFQETGISVAEGLTFAEFSVGDTVVLIMMWLLPALCGVALVSMAQWKFMKFMMRKMVNMWLASFRRQPAAEQVDKQV